MSMSEHSKTTSMTRSNQNRSETPQANIVTINYPNGDKYKGVTIEMNDDQGIPQPVPDNSIDRPGYGLMIYANGDKYDGMWIKGKRNGKGRRFNADGSTYEGYYEDDKPHGKGTYHWAEGDKYSG